MFLQINLNKFCISYILSWKYPMPLWVWITETWPCPCIKNTLLAFPPSYQERGGQFKDKIDGLFQILSYSPKILAVKLFCCAVQEAEDLEWPNYRVFLSSFQKSLTRSCNKLVIETWLNIILWCLWPLTCNYLFIQYLQNYHNFHLTHNRKTDAVKISYTGKSQKWESSWSSSSKIVRFSTIKVQWETEGATYILSWKSIYFRENMS